MKTIMNNSYQTGNGQRGTALVMALFIITVLTVVGTMVLNTSIVEVKMAQNQKISAQVFFAAESGLERGLLMHIMDFEQDLTSANAPWGNDSFVGWAESTSPTIMAGTKSFNINTRSLDMYLDGNDTNLKRMTLGGGNTVNNCTFDLYRYVVSNNEVYVMSYATGNGGMAAVEYHLVVSNVSPYNNAIFSNSGLNGNLNGSVDIAGSIYSRGNVEPNGDVGFWNRYEDIKKGLGALAGIIENESDLNAVVRITDGDLSLTGSAQVGTAGTDGAFDGIYVDGTSNADSTNSWADEYSNVVPDVPLPSIMDGLNDHFGATTVDACAAAYTGDDTAIAASLYADWAESGGCLPTATSTTGVVWEGDLEITKSTGSFSLTDSIGNGITYTAPGSPPTYSGTGVLTIQGTVVINGDFEFGDAQIDGLDYSATGIDDGSGSDAADGATLFVNGDFTANGNFYPTDGYLMGDTYPATNDINSLGVIAAGNINFEGHNDDAYTGFFYAEDTVNFNKQAKFGGTVIADDVFFWQVPDVFQVPNLADYLPPGVPGGSDVFQLTRREWRRVY